MTRKARADTRYTHRMIKKGIKKKVDRNGIDADRLGIVMAIEAH